MTMNIEGLDALQVAFSEAPEIVKEKMGGAILTSAKSVMAKAKANAPFKLGQLKDSIQLDGPNFSASNIQASVYTNVKYAPYQEFGTGIYGPNGTPIVPKNAPFLVFQLDDGTWRRARSVKGVKPKKFFGNAVDTSQDEVNNNLLNALTEVVQALATV